MTDTTLYKGFLTNKNADMQVWVGKFENDADGVKLEIIEGTIYMTTCVIEKIIKKNDYFEDLAYQEEINNMMGEHDLTCEFIVDDDCFYVGLREVTEPVPTRMPVIVDVYRC